MAKPNLSIKVSPDVNGKLYYLLMAPSEKGGKARIKIIARLTITNHESVRVRITGIAFHFPGSTHKTRNMKSVTKAVIPLASSTYPTVPSAIANNGYVKSGETAVWYNGTVNKTTGDDPPQDKNQVYLEGSVPKKISIHIKCSNFSDVIKKDLILSRYIKPTSEGAFLFPFSVADLKDGEYFVTNGQHWANEYGSGLQIYAHDIMLHGVNDGELSELKEGITKGKHNSDFRIEGVPVRAMADGTVVEAYDDSTENSYNNGKFPDSPPDANHITIKHGSIYVSYLHFKKNSIPEYLKVTNAFVRAGEKVGLAGNSGNASGPHTHIQCAKDSASGGIRPFVFRKAWILDKEDNNPPDLDGDWVRLDAEGIPKEDVSIWPESTSPGWKIPTAGLFVAGDWEYKFWKGNDYKSFKTKAQDLFNKGFPLTYASSFKDGEHRRWVGVFHKGNEGITFWVSNDWESFITEANSLHKKNGKRLIHVHAFEEDGDIKFFGLARTGSWSNEFWMSDSFDKLKAHAATLVKNKNRHLVHVSNVVIDGERKWIGISRGASYTTELFYTLSLSAFQNKLKSYKKQGKECINMFPYFKDGDHRWIGIVRKINSGTQMWQNSNWDSFCETTRYAQQSQGLRLMAVEFIS